MRKRWIRVTTHSYVVHVLPVCVKRFNMRTHLPLVHESEHVVARTKSDWKRDSKGLLSFFVLFLGDVKSS